MSDVVPSLYRFGRIEDESIDFYHATDCMSKTKLDCFIQSPNLYWRKHVVKTLPKEEPSEALIIGQAVDTLALEGPEAFAKRFADIPIDAPRKPTTKQRAMEKRTPAAKLSIEFWDSWNETNRGKMPLTSDQMALVQRCADSLHSDEWFQMLMTGGKSQVTFRLEGRYVSLQCRPDRWCPEGNELVGAKPCILDLKTIGEMPADQVPNYATLEPENNHVEDHLPKHIANFGYHRSAWWYREVVAAVEKMGDYRPPFILCFVEKVEPYAVSCRVVDEVALGVADREIQTAMRRLVDCIRTGRWPHYWNKPTASVGLPGYYVRQVLNTYGSPI